MMHEPLLEVKNINKVYPPNTFKVLESISFEVYQSQTLGIVGENGSGKSTLARIISLLEQPSSGNILFKGSDITHFSRQERHRFYHDVQYVFQNPLSSFNPLRTFGEMFREIYRNNNYSDEESYELIVQQLQDVGLSEEIINRYPHQVSGGQAQRVAIARAMAMKPTLLLCDEITSDLDMVTKKSIVDLIQKMKDQHQLTILFITHDLSLVNYICDVILVMKNGKIVEYGDSQQVLNHPQNKYTKQLIEASFLKNK